MFNKSETSDKYKDIAEMARSSFNKNVLEKRYKLYSPKTTSTSANTSTGTSNSFNIKVKTIHKNHYNIVLFNKTAILPHKELDALEDSVKLKLPEMTFVNNTIKVNYNNLYEYTINSLDCLNTVKREHNADIQVVNSKHWEKHKPSHGSSDDKNVLDPMLNFDWTYTPDNYIGKVNFLSTENSPNVEMIDQPESKIPYNKISLKVPIKHFSTILHFEDELNDNGVTLLYSRIRVVDTKIPFSEKKIKYCYILTRFFLKVDKVIARTIDLRTYINLKKPNKINIQIDHYEKKLNENEDLNDEKSSRINKLKSFEDVLEKEHDLLNDLKKLEEKSRYITLSINNI